MNNTLSDVIIKLNVETPSVPINLGNLALFVKGSTQKVEKFNSYEELQRVYGTNTAAPNNLIVQAGNGYFSQESHGSKLILVTYTDISAAASAYYGEGWEFASVIPSIKVAGSSLSPGSASNAVEYDFKDDIALSSFIDSRKERFSVVGLPATTENINGIADKKKSFGNSERTIIFVSGSDQAEAEYGIGGLVGAVGNETVGSVTWKFRKIGGVKPVDLTVPQIQKLHENNAFTYVTKAGIDQTSEGKTLAGEYIDALHGDDWIKASLETELQKLLSNSDKLTFDAAGIAQIDATVTAVLTDATSNGIISVNPETNAGEFSVTTASREESSDKDFAERNYTGLQFSYTRSGAIHTVQVNGQINI